MKAWLKGGMIGMGIYLVFSLFIFLKMFFVGECINECAFIFIFLVVPSSIIFPFFGTGHASSFWIYWILNILIVFMVVSVIGFVIGKIKQKESVEK